MAQLYYDFSQQPPGSGPPAGWQEVGTSGKVSIVDYAVGGRAMQVKNLNSAAFDTACIWADLGAVSRPLECVFKYLATSDSVTEGGFIALADTTNWNAYVGMLQPRSINQNFQFSRYDAGSKTNLWINGNVPILPDTIYWVRVRFNTDGTINLKIWRDGNSEPQAWATTLTDNTYTSGQVGVEIQRFNTYYYYWVGVGTNGDAAPTSAGSGTTVLDLAATGAAQATANATLVRSALMDLHRAGASSARAGLAALRRLEVIGIAAAGGDADLVTTALLPLAVTGTGQSISTALLARALTPEVLSRVATAAQAALFATRTLITTARAIAGSQARFDRTAGAALNLAVTGAAASAADLLLLRTMGAQVLARALTDAHFRAARTVVLEAADQAVSSLRTVESVARRLEVTSRAASALWAALTSSAATVLTAALVGRGLSDGEAHLLTTRLMESAGRIGGTLLATQVLRRLLGVTGSVEAQLQADPTDVRALEAALSGAATSAMSLSRAVLGYVVPEAFTIHVPANPLYVRVPANPLYVRVPPKSYA